MTFTRNPNPNLNPTRPKKSKQFFFKNPNNIYIYKPENPKSQKPKPNPKTQKPKNSKTQKNLKNPKSETQKNFKNPKIPFVTNISSSFISPVMDSQKNGSLVCS